MFRRSSPKRSFRNSLVERLLYTDPATGRVITYDHDVPFYKGQMRKVFSDNGRIDPTEIRDYIGPRRLFRTEQGPLLHDAGAGDR